MVTDGESAAEEPTRRPTMDLGETLPARRPSSRSRPTSTSTDGTRRRRCRRPRGRRSRVASRAAAARAARQPAEEARSRVGAELGRDHVRRRQERLSRAARPPQRPPPEVRSDPSGALGRGAAQRPGDDRSWMLVDARRPGWSPPGRSTRCSPSWRTRRRPTRRSTARCGCAPPVTPTWSLDRPDGDRDGRSGSSPWTWRRCPPGRRPTPGCARPRAATYAWCGATTRPAAACSPGSPQPGDHAAFPDCVPGDARRSPRCAGSTTGSSSVRSSWARSRPSRCRSSGSAPTWSSTATSRSPRTTGAGPRGRGPLPRGKPVGRCVMATHRPAHAGDGQGADPHAGPPPPRRRQDALRRPPGPADRGPDPRRRRGHAP